MEMIVIRRGEEGRTGAPIFEYLEAVFTSDIATMDKFTPASTNPEIAKKVADMPGMSQAILERGYNQGREQEQRERIEEMLRDGHTPEEIVNFCKYPMDLVLDVQKNMLVMA